MTRTASLAALPALAALLLTASGARADETAPDAAPAAEAVAEAEPVAIAEPAPAPEPTSPYLDVARAALAKNRHADALRALDFADQQADLPDVLRRQVRAVRVQALLTQKKAETARARSLVIDALREDLQAPEFDGAPEPVASLVSEVRATQTLVLHEPAPSRPGRPARLRARVVDPTARVAGLTLHFKAQAVPDYQHEPMRKDAQGYSGFVRAPDALAPAGVSDAYVIDYFLTAEDASGRVLDSLGTAARPLALEIDEAKALARSVDLSAVATVRADYVAPAEPAAPAETPWYLRWYTLTGAGVVVAGIIAGTVIALSQPAADYTTSLGEPIQLP